MRKIIVLTFLSLDGVMQAPGGSKEDQAEGFQYGGWTAPFFDDEAGKLMEVQMEQPFNLLLGRKTFDIFSGYWPEHSEKWPGINESTKYVVSNTLKDPKWENTVVISGDVVAELKKIKEMDGPDIQVHGSGNLIQTLLRNDLVDELWLKTFPLTIGTGKKLFAEGTQPMAFKLISSNVLSSGVIFANYKRDGEVKTGNFA